MHLSQLRLLLILTSSCRKKTIASRYATKRGPVARKVCSNIFLHINLLHAQLSSNRQNEMQLRRSANSRLSDLYCTAVVCRLHADICSHSTHSIGHHHRHSGGTVMQAGRRCWDDSPSTRTRNWRHRVELRLWHCISLTSTWLAPSSTAKSSSVHLRRPDLKYVIWALTRISLLVDSLEWCSTVHSKRSFRRSLNATFGKIGRVTFEDVILELIKSKCFPNIVYGLDCFFLT